MSPKRLFVTSITKSFPRLYKTDLVDHTALPMILASFLDIAINLTFVVQIIVTCLLLLVVLMQRPKQEGLGAAFGSAITDQAFGAQTTDVLKKSTVIFGSLFMLIAFVLCILLNMKYKENLPTLSQSPIPVQSQEASTEGAKQKSVTELIQEQEKKDGEQTNPTPQQQSQQTPPASPEPAKQTPPAGQQQAPAQNK